MSIFTKTVCTIALLIAGHMAAVADARSTLRVGPYQAGIGGCKSPTGVGSMDFDGDNFSGNGQFCRTAVLGTDRYRLTCISLATVDGKAFTKADFDKVPQAQKESFDLTIKITGGSFSIDGTPYEFCGAAQ